MLKKKKVVPFEKLTKPEQRVAIAKDVLKLIKSGKIHPSTGTYFTEYDLEEKVTELIDKKESVELQSLLKKRSVKECSVCALGGMFVADILKNDDFQVGKVGRKEIVPSDNYFMTKRLKKYFPELQLRLIENAFERDQALIVKDSEIARDFGMRFQNDEDRLIGIMKNIIANTGTFKP